MGSELPTMKIHRFASLSSPRALLVALAITTALASSGCMIVAAGAAGAGTVAYLGRELQANLPNDYDSVVDATREALKGLEFARVSENKDALKAVFISRTALDKKVAIIVTNAGRKSTMVSVQVGHFGDRELSMSVLDKIKSLL